MLKPHEKIGLAGLIALRDKLNTGWRPDEEYTGICYQLYYHFTEPSHQTPSSYDLVRKWCRGWDEHSGEPEYPVNENADGDTWAGAARDARIRLISYMIGQLEAADAQQAS